MHTTMGRRLRVPQQATARCGAPGRGVAHHARLHLLAALESYTCHKERAPFTSRIGSSRMTASSMMLQTGPCAHTSLPAWAYGTEWLTCRAHAKGSANGVAWLGLLAMRTLIRPTSASCGSSSSAGNSSATSSRSFSWDGMLPMLWPTWRKYLQARIGHV
jgi:hypothetical protein